MNAKQMQSIATLEEWFQTLYVDLASGEYENNNEIEDSKLNLIMNSGYKELFFSTSEGYCLKKVVPVELDDGTSTTQTYTFYLIQKDRLPKEVSSQIMGADNVDSRNYRKLQNVYGITSDLKVYYCKDGFETILGLNMSDINKDSPDIVSYNKESILAQMVNGGTSDLTNQDLKTIKTLTINNAGQLSVLSSFKDLYYLKIVNFANIAIPSLNGISGAENITEVQFENCSCDDYSDLCGLSKLNILYLIIPKNKNKDVETLCDKTKGIAKANFSNLEYFGIVGNKKYLQTTDSLYVTSKYDITDISGLANLTDTTKQAIKYLYINNNNISDITSLSGFTNVLILRMDANSIETFDGIQNMSKLQYLIAPYCYDGSAHTLGSKEGTGPGDSDALDFIYKDENGKNESLCYLNLKVNSNLKYVDGLSQCDNLRILYLDGCTNIRNMPSISSVLANCGKNYTIDSKYTKEIISDDIISINLASQKFTKEEFEQLKNREKLEAVCLSGITISNSDGTELSQTTSPTFNEEVNLVLKTCSNLKHVELNANTNLTSIEFVTDTPNLVSINLVGTSVGTADEETGLQLLNNNCSNLGTIVLNGSPELIDLTKIQTAINKISKNCFDEEDGNGKIGFGSEERKSQ